MSWILVVAGCTSGSKEAPPAPDQVTRKPATDPAGARQLLAQGAVAVDVRSPGEFADGHVAGAVNVPVQHVAARVAEIEQLLGGDRTKPLVVYCGTGARSARAKETLAAAGFTHVVNGGGYDDLR